MNSAIRLMLVFIIALEISLVANLSLNIAVIIGALAILFWQHLHLKTFLFISLLALLPALGIFLSQLYYGGSHGFYRGIILFSRLYAYVFLGLSFSLTTSPINLAHALEQNLHVPAKFIYGILAALNLLPRLRYEIKVIRANGNMRGKTLHPWQPTLYFKALILAINWSNNLSLAMQSQGFVENEPRTHFSKPIVTKLDWSLSLIILGAVQCIIIFCH
ncbi:Transmembrane component YkoC [Fructilactobacillus florum 8D]|uniref:Transmembrane component YkoC n=2 Tax=Fructilactobacillus florum TaxID=640331 RepID=W9EHN4_9LACO|nr:energy-coupling factor transporter transmembrane component T [Fructilactobacillus florum]ETO40495.1 Transmembrane component YkoC [Fructilactobacillus florum 8D]KRM91321.1 hypothetical protein FC87_GL001041 [Fructilactobacillus florum DSM 22689 = JCM 16035]